MQGKFLVVFAHWYNGSTMAILCDDGWKTSDGTPKYHPWKIMDGLEQRLQAAYGRPSYVHGQSIESLRKLLALFRPIRENGALYKRLAAKDRLPRQLYEYDVVPLADLFS